KTSAQHGRETFFYKSVSGGSMEEEGRGKAEVKGGDAQGGPVPVRRPGAWAKRPRRAHRGGGGAGWGQRPRLMRPNSPAKVPSVPSTNSQMASSEGAPVTASVTSEPKLRATRTPQTMRTMPTRASAAYRPFSIRCRSFRRPLQGFSSADDADQQHDDGDHQKDVDEAAYGICGNHTEKPKNNKDDGDRIKHDE